MILFKLLLRHHLNIDVYGTLSSQKELVFKTLISQIDVFMAYGLNFICRIYLLKLRVRK